MSLENVEAVRRSFDARNRGDIDAVLADTAEDVEVDFSRSRAPWAGVYRGRESLREAWQRLVESFDSVWWEAEEFIDAGEAVVVISRFYTRGRGSGVESVAHGAQVYWVEDGKIVRYVQCQNRAEALEAVGSATHRHNERMATVTAPKTLESFSPLTGERIGSVPTLQPDEVQAVVDDVASVQPFWAQLPLAGRARYMKRAQQAILDQIDDLAQLLAREQGKPLSEAYIMELIPTVDALGWIADAGQQILADERIPQPQVFTKLKKSSFSYEPLGVVGVIAPWNYPWSIPFGEVAMALMAGNGVVLKPASLTPLIGDRIRAIFERAGFPDGLVRTIHGGGAVGNALVESTASKIFFTGSVEVGRRVGVACAERLKGSVLELGGKDAQIVCADANLEHAISGCLWGSFANAGQTCAGIERVYVVREVAERFTEGVVRGAQALRVGDPLSFETEIGPMVSREQYELVKELVDDAVTNGAELRCGGPVEVDGYEDAAFYAPAVLTNVTHDMRIMREEIFGPVVPIITVDSEEEAVQLANDSNFGLSASVWTLDKEKGDRIARRIEAGSVWINDHMYSHGTCQCSWGGVKESGIGRAHSKFGFYECVNIKHVAWEPSKLKNFWWHPYDEQLGLALKASAKLLYGPRKAKIEALRTGVGPLTRLTQRLR